jgi:manganese/iron transport system permease protein
VIDALLEPLALGFFVRALIASAMVGVVCAVVGTYVVLRGIAFIGDAIAHAAFPGVVAAYLLAVPFYLGAAIAAVATALAIGVVTKRAGIRQDTAIGVLFAGTFALGVFMFSSIQGYVADLFSFLFGNVLAIGPQDLVALLALGLGVIVVVAVLWKELLYATFDPLGAAASGIQVERLEYLFLALVALTIVVSLQAVGIILVVAMLVTPAATAQLLTVRFMRLMLLAATVGIASAVIGLYLSYWLDVASGATIVLVQTGLFCWPRARAPWRDRAPPGRHAEPPGAAGVTRVSRAIRAVEALDDAGYRLTGPRRAVADLVAARDGWFTAADIASDARRGRVSVGRATIFRSLDVFAGLGLVERVDRPDGSHAYVACDPAHHHHAICTGCGRSLDVADAGLDEALRRIGPRLGFRVTSHRVELFGVCATCDAAERR